MQSAARLVIQDWHSGRIPYYTVPPQRDTSGDTPQDVQLVPGWAPEFDAANAATLRTLPEDASDLHFSAPSAGPMAVDMSTAEAAGEPRQSFEAQLQLYALQIIGGGLRASPQAGLRRECSCLFSRPCTCWRAAEAHLAPMLVDMPVEASKATV